MHLLYLLLCMQVILHVATRLQELHNAGYAHHDIKPVNLVWILREDQWKLIDLGSAAPLGYNAPLRFTLAYAAPEVLRAWKNGEKTIVSTTAIDAWALGVMVYEMLTCKPAFGMLAQGRDSVRSCLSWLNHRLRCIADCL
jgi:serine/threonine protein kinase